MWYDHETDRGQNGPAERKLRNGEDWNENLDGLLRSERCADRFTLPIFSYLT